MDDNPTPNIELALAACSLPTSLEQIDERAKATVPAVEKVLDEADGALRKIAITCTRHRLAPFPNTALFDDALLDDLADVGFEAFANIQTKLLSLKFGEYPTYLGRDGHTELRIIRLFDWDPDDFAKNGWTMRSFLEDGHIIVTAPVDPKDSHTTYVVPALTMAETYIRHLETVARVRDEREAEPLYRPDFDQFRATLRLEPAIQWTDIEIRDRLETVVITSVLTVVGFIFLVGIVWLFTASIFISG